MRSLVISRAALGFGVVGVAALGLALVVSLLGGVLMPSYLAAWLFCLGVPVGALAVLMALEIAGAPLAPVAAPLRGVAAAMPVLAVLALPVLLRAGALFGPDRATFGFVLRAVVILAAWTVLSLIFMRPPPQPGGLRRGVAVGGLAVHMVIGTVAATDWAEMLDPGLGSSVFGLLLMMSQCGAAVSAAVLLSACNARPWVAPRGLAALFLSLLGIWMFLEFTQFLTVWSANLPNEVTWYQRRDAGWGTVLEWTAVGACLTALFLLLPRRYEVLTTSLAFAAGAVLVAHVIEAFWLVTPAFRNRMGITLADLLALCGLGGLLIGACLALGRWTEDRVGRA